MKKENWKQLRDDFFNECTDSVEYLKRGGDISRTRVNIAPHDLFEWFKDNVQKILDSEASGKDAVEVLAETQVYKNRYDAMKEHLTSQVETIVQLRADNKTLYELLNKVLKSEDQSTTSAHSSK